MIYYYKLIYVRKIVQIIMIITVAVRMIECCYYKLNIKCIRHICLHCFVVRQSAIYSIMQIDFMNLFLIRWQ